MISTLLSSIEIASASYLVLGMHYFYNMFNLIVCVMYIIVLAYMLNSSIKALYYHFHLIVYRGKDTLTPLNMFVL